MMRFLVVTMSMVLSTSVFAQDKTIPGDFLKGMASDLAKIQELTQQARHRAALSEDKLAAIRVTSPNAFARQEADVSSSMAIKLHPGEVLPVTEAKPGWYGVEVPGSGKKWISANDAVLTSPPVAQKYQDIFGQANELDTQVQTDNDSSLVSALLSAASEFRMKYANNPYVNVSGFDISLTLVPSVTVSFEFK